MTRPTTTGKAQDLITFTRSTTGTALAKISYGEELVTNGTFDNDAVGATPSTWQTNSANASLIKQSDGTALFSSASYAYARVANADRPIIPAGVYKVSFSISGTSGSLSNVHVGVGTGGNTISGDGDYQYLFTSTSEQAYELQIRPNGGGTGAFKIDNISIKEVLYDQPDGTLQLFNHPINKPRIEYDASGNCLGLLVEEARTNLVTYSEDFSNVQWAPVRTAPLALDSAGPDGKSNSAVKLLDNSAGGTGTVYLRDTVTVSTSTTYTESVYAKADQLSQLLMYANAFTTPQNNGFVFDLSNGTYSAYSGTPSMTAAMQSVGNGWYRCSITFTTDATDTSGQVQMYLYKDNGVQVPLDGTSSILLFGAQFEQGSFPTSYIPTSGSTVTRAADIATLAVSEFGYNQDQGSVVVEFDHNDLNDESTQYLLSSTSSSRFIYNNANSQNWQAFDGQSALPFGNVLGNGLPVKLGLGMGSSESSSINNGVLQNTTNATPQDNVGSLLYFGLRYNGANSLNGHIKSVQYYPLRLSNAQLQALTV